MLLHHDLPVPNPAHIPGSRLAQLGVLNAQDAGECSGGLRGFRNPQAGGFLTGQACAVLVREQQVSAIRPFRVAGNAVDQIDIGLDIKARFARECVENVHVQLLGHSRPEFYALQRDCSSSNRVFVQTRNH